MNAKFFIKKYFYTRNLCLPHFGDLETIQLVRIEVASVFRIQVDVLNLNHQNNAALSLFRHKFTTRILSWIW